jgi:hypothetical protein
MRTSSPTWGSLVLMIATRAAKMGVKGREEAWARMMDVLAKQLGHDVLDVGHVDLAIVSATMMRSIRPSAQKDSRPVKIVTA